MFDGDTIFTMATGKVDANFNSVGILAARAVEYAILQAIRSAEPLSGFPSHNDIFK